MLGPFHTHEAETISNGQEMSSDPQGESCLVVCNITDVRGTPIEGVKIDIWETDSTGHYDVQYSERDGPDGRCVMKSDERGFFWFKAIVPVPYPIPHDGPVGQLLKLLNRHPWRPAHMHFMFEKAGWDHLITYALFLLFPFHVQLQFKALADSCTTRALYVRGDPYETSDAVFGVKQSLIIDFETVDEGTAQQYGVKVGSKVLKHTFVLVSDQETEKLRDENALAAMKKLGRTVKLLNHLPVPDVD